VRTDVKVVTLEVKLNSDVRRWSYNQRLLYPVQNIYVFFVDRWSL